MSKTWDFKEQLALGLKAQQEFMEFYHEPVVLATTLAYDFKVVSSGKKLELKADDWDHEETENFFFERWSDVHKEKPGGPWQSRKKRADVFVYLFSRNGIYYQFNDIKRLCKVLEQIVRREKLGLIYIKNKGWFTAGYKIPRHMLEELYEVYEVPGI